ncbi:MAG: rod shape-determining protein RodA [Bacteroidia bacterium]|nr:rod shape-determining protein RodA [Bacteroidia bacterium]
MRKQRHILEGIDPWLVGLYVVLVLLGWMNIYAAVFNEEHRNIFDISQNYGKQMIWIVSSFFLALMVMVIDGKFYAAFSWPIYIVVMVLLLATIGLARDINGQKAWIEIGGFQIQAAEFAKFAANLALAKYLSQLNIKMEDFETKLKAGLIIFTPFILILLQNDTGSALVFTAFIFVLYREGLSGNILLFGAGAGVLAILSLLFPKEYILIGIGIIVGLLLILIPKNWQNMLVVGAFALIMAAMVMSVNVAFDKLQPHQKERIEILLGKRTDNKGAGYNVNQSKIAIGSGGLIGKGFLQGTQTKYDFVPEQSTDFIFCTVGEEWGFLGSIVVIILFLVLFLRVVFVAERQRSPFTRIYGYGVASILLFHFSINIGMTIGLLPVIGIPLPFFSYGGSSLWSFTILLFILIKLDAYRLQILR